MSDNHTSFRSSTTTYLPSYSTRKPQSIQARNESKLKTNYAYKQKYRPFVVPPSIYHVVFLNKRTDIETAHSLMNHVQDCRGFIFDTESDTSNYELALIQIQTFPRKLPVYVILLELAHLPPQESTLHLAFKQFFQLVFKPDNMLFAWGQLDKEIYPALHYNLFTWPISSTIINVQSEFRHWYNWARSHCEVCCPQTTCSCHEPDPYLPHEQWSLQKALIYTSGLFLDKSMTLGRWAAGLQSSQSSLSKAKQTKLILYAIHDCFATTYFIQPLTQQWTFYKLSNANFIDLFQAPSSISTSKLLLSSSKTSSSKSSSYYRNTNTVVNDIKPQTFKNVIDNDLEFISEDSDEEILLTQSINPVNTQELYETVSDDDYHSTMKLKINDVVSSVNNHAVVVDDERDDNICINNSDKQQVFIKNHPRRSLKAKQRRNRKRNNIFRARRYRLFIIRPIYYRFSIRLIKFILNKFNVKYIHIKITGASLIIGVKNEELKDYNEHLLPRHIFDRRHYYLYKKQYQQQQ